MDLMQEDEHHYRVAFIEAFRRRGIYPRDVRTLSEDSLRWARPGEEQEGAPGESERMLAHFIKSIGLREQVDKLRYLATREQIWGETRKIRAALHQAIQGQVAKAELLQRLTGLALAEFQAPPNVSVRRDGHPVFTVQALREARRLGEDGRILNQVFITLLQKERVVHEGNEHVIRSGSTIVLDLETQKVSYVIGKGLNDQKRILRTIAFREGEDGAHSLAATYFDGTNEPFAALHNSGA
jgi:hypothetical protein